MSMDCRRKSELLERGHADRPWIQDCATNLKSHFFRQALNKMSYYNFVSPTLLAISSKECVIGTYKGLVRKPFLPCCGVCTSCFPWLSIRL